MKEIFIEDEYLLAQQEQEKQEFYQKIALYESRLNGLGWDYNIKQEI